MKMFAFALAGVVTLAPTLATSVSAGPVADPLAVRKAADAGDVVKVGGFWWGFGPAFVGGAIVGGAIATAPYRYPYGPYYGPYPYGPYYGPPGPPVAYGPGYPPPAGVAAAPPPRPVPGPGAAPPPTGRVASANTCARHKGFDPESNTFVGLDGLRHPCP